jgi:hypothetical protein
MKNLKPVNKVKSTNEINPVGKIKSNGKINTAGKITQIDKINYRSQVRVVYAPDSAIARPHETSPPIIEPNFKTEIQTR